MSPDTENIITVIKSIPPGRVLSYGRAAEMAGLQRGARQVARILHSMSRKHDLPWHRVVRKDGSIAFGVELYRVRQIELLENEGVPVEEGRVDMTKYMWHG